MNSFEECWSYFLHSLTAEVHSIVLLTHVQLARHDQNGNLLQNILVSISVGEEENIYDSITNTLSNQYYLYSSAADLEQGRMISFLCSGKSSCTLYPPILYIDRYLEINNPILEPLVQEERKIEEEIQELCKDLDSISDADITVLTDTIEFLDMEFENSIQIREELLLVKDIMLKKIGNIKTAIYDLELRARTLYARPDLEKYPFQYGNFLNFSLYAVFREDFNNNHYVYLNFQESWWAMNGKEVKASTYESALNDEGKLTCVWYAHTPLGFSSLPIPSQLASLIEKDNEDYAKEVFIFGR